MLVLGSWPNSLRQPQNSFVSVRSSQWTSRPITASKLPASREFCCRRHAPVATLVVVAPAIR